MSPHIRALKDRPMPPDGQLHVAPHQLEDMACHGGMTEAAERSVIGMLHLTAQLGSPDKRLLL